MPVNLLYTFPQMRTELQFRVGGRTDLGSGSADRLNQWLDSAQLRLASATFAMEDLDQIAFPLTTLSGQSEYSLYSVLPPATDIIGVKSIRNDTSGIRLRRFPWQEYRSLNQQAQGAPLRYARFGNVLAFDPQPDTNGPYSLLIDYRREPIRGKVEVPNRLAEYMLTVAEWIAWQSLMKPDRAMAAFKMLPPGVAAIVSQPLDRDQWESMNDPDLGIRPTGFDYPYLVS